MSGRRLYDAGSSVTGSPSLTPLVPTLVARANPYDLDRLGAKTGDRVKVRSARGELILAAESDEGVARGVVAIDFNVPGGESAPPNAVATLIDSRQLGDRRATGVGVIAAAALLANSAPILTHSADNGNGDPLFYFGLNWEVWLIVIIKCLVAFVALLVATALMIWFERKVISDMQSRIGPNRAGPWGLLQTLADGTKLIFKEDLLPDRADSFVFKLAPYLSVIPAVLIFTVVPVGGVITIGSHTFELQVADPPMGILLVLAMSGIAVYGVMLAGWSSGSKYPLLGSVRASAQVISYEAALGMTTVMVVLVSRLALDPGHRGLAGERVLELEPHPARASCPSSSS